MWRCCLCAGLLAGCGRFGFGEHDGNRDGALPGDGRGDSPNGDAAICHTGTWSTPTLLAEIATASEERGPSLSRDELTLYFMSNRSGGMARAIWQTTRGSPTGIFGTPTVISALDSAADDGDPEISGDNLTMYYSSKRSGADELYWATRPDVAAPFVEQGVIPITGDISTVRFGPSLSPDELTIYYIGDLDIQLATRAAKTDAFAWVREMTELDAPQTESSPSITDDGLEIFFESFRTGPGEIYVASRASTSDAFSAPTLLSVLDTGASAGEPTLTPDGSTAYFYIANGGQDDIYTSTRTCP